MSKLRRAALLGAIGLTAVACKGSTSSGSPGAGGNTGSAGAAGTGATGSGGRGGSGAAGTTGTAGSTATAGTTGSAGSGAGATGGGATGGGGSSGTSGSAGTSGGAGAGGADTGGSGATAGATGTGGTGADPCATALFCDDFEKYVVNTTPGSPWSRETSTGSTVVIDTAQFHSGGQSVKFVAAAGSGSKTAYLHLMSTSVLPVMPNMFYGRMMFRLEAAPTGDVHWTFLEGYGQVPGQTYHALYRYGGQHPIMNGSTFVGSQLMANYETPDSYSGMGPSSDCWQHANKVVVPEAKWSCVEWQFDGTSNTMRLWLDGAAIDSLTVMGAGQGCGTATPVWTAPTFSRMDIGWESYQQDTARTIWIDDFALSKTKIGCPP